MENHKDTYYSHFIPKPETVKPSFNESTIVVIDSKDRNKLLYPDSNNYVMPLQTPLTDILEIELISAYYRYNVYQLNKSNNKLFFKIVNDDFNIELRLLSGNYDEELLISQFTKTFENYKKINDLSCNIAMKYSDILNRFYFIIDTDQIFECDFKGDEMIYPSTTFGDNVTDTNIFRYRKGTNGLYFGFSENIFSNKLEIYSLLIKKINNNIIKFTIDFMNNVTHLQQLSTILQIYDTDFKLHFIDQLNNDTNKYTFNFQDVDAFNIDNNIVEIYVKLENNSNLINMDNKIILNPNIYTNIILGDIPRKIYNDQYVLLHINEFNRLNSINTNIQDSYVKIPILQDEYIYFDNTKNYGTIKYCNPVLRSLDRLSIKIIDRNGNFVDSNGSDNTFVFAIRCLNKSSNLSN